jgi:ribosomal-protein-alanine N-acetyltransferase
VFEECDELLAYGLISVAANEAHILNICVSPNAQGKGLGKRMLYRLIRSAEERGAESIFLEVRASNVIAQNLYEQEGFNRLGVRPAYYPSSDGREDALVFAKAINLLNSYGFKEN